MIRKRVTNSSFQINTIVLRNAQFRNILNRSTRIISFTVNNATIIVFNAQTETIYVLVAIRDF